MLGKDLGTTNVLFWNRDGPARRLYRVEVTHDLDGLKRQVARALAERADRRLCGTALHRAAGLACRASPTWTRRCSSRGLPRADRTTAKEEQQFEQRRAGPRARGQTGGQVINLLRSRGAQQVMLEVKVAEIARTELERFADQVQLHQQRGRRLERRRRQWRRDVPGRFFQPGNLRIPVFPGASAVRAGHRRIRAERHVDRGHRVCSAASSTTTASSTSRSMRQGEGPREDPGGADADDVDRPGGAVPVGRRVPDTGAAGDERHRRRVQGVRRGAAVPAGRARLRPHQSQAQHQRERAGRHRSNVRPARRSGTTATFYSGPARAQRERDGRAAATARRSASPGSSTRTCGGRRRSSRASATCRSSASCSAARVPEGPDRARDPRDAAARASRFVRRDIRLPTDAIHGTEAARSSICRAASKASRRRPPPPLQQPRKRALRRAAGQAIE